MPKTAKEWRLRIEVGTTFRRRGQRYEIVGFTPHTCADGREIELVRLASNCPDCGRPFEASASRRNVRGGHLARRCPRHAKRGVPVAKRVRPAAARHVALGALPAGAHGVGEADSRVVIS
jgi:hypothetical protein